jgi:uncharacterized SAM-binding protein YcdF (DUF218 family)
MARPFRLLVGVLAVIGALAVLTLTTPVTGICAHRMSGPILAPTASLLIVLTAAEPVDDMLSGSTYWRAIYTVRAWRTGGFERILLSGRQSDVMKRFLVSQGIPASQIDLEEKANSTRESALFISAMFRGHSGPPPVLMTSDYHMFRARKCFEKVGFPIVPRPIPDAIKRAADWSNRPTILAIEIEEFCKIAGYRLRGWI